MPRYSGDLAGRLRTTEQRPVPPPPPPPPDTAKITSDATKAATTAATASATQAATTIAAGVAAQIPEPANASPPAVSDASAHGISRRYALADHTHASSVQGLRVGLTMVNGLATWVYPKPFDTGVVPVIEVTAETPAGANFKYDAGIVEGSVTNKQCQIRVSRMSQSIVGGITQLFMPATGTVFVHCWARKPTA